MTNIAINLWEKRSIAIVGGTDKHAPSFRDSCTKGDVFNEEYQKCCQRQLQTVQVVHTQDTGEAESSTLHGGPLLIDHQQSYHSSGKMTNLFVYDNDLRQEKSYIH